MDVHLVPNVFFFSAGNFSDLMIKRVHFFKLVFTNCKDLKATNCEGVALYECKSVCIQQVYMSFNTFQVKLQIMTPSLYFYYFISLKIQKDNNKSNLNSQLQIKFELRRFSENSKSAKTNSLQLLVDLRQTLN